MVSGSELFAADLCSWDTTKRSVGIQPSEAGVAEVLIRPSLGDLAWADGLIPTHYGDIHIHVENGLLLSGCITLPNGITGTLILEDRHIALQAGEICF
jgi:Bacterial alpha-L-rhamnosidase C-terminal domain